MFSLAQVYTQSLILGWGSHRVLMMLVGRYAVCVCVCVFWARPLGKVASLNFSAYTQPYTHSYR